jgi:hypothetical protein
MIKVGSKQQTDSDALPVLHFTEKFPDGCPGAANN